MKFSNKHNKRTKANVLQWKIVHNINPTNYYLKQIHIKDNNICEECNESDTIIHHFYKCKLVINLSLPTLSQF